MVGGFGPGEARVRGRSSAQNATNGPEPCAIWTGVPAPARSGTNHRAMGFIGSIGNGMRVLSGAVAGLSAKERTTGRYRERRLTPAEIAYADQVFEGTVPLDRVFVANDAGLGIGIELAIQVGDDFLVDRGGFG